MTRKLPAWLESARSGWRWNGRERPAFAQTPREGQESVWDYPRPPVLVPDSREVTIGWGAVQVARSSRTIRALETSHPPSFYIPWDDVARELLQPAGGGSFCEWKGPAAYWSLHDQGRELPRVAWSYPSPLPGAEQIADCVAFYPGALTCHVGGEQVIAQPGGFYGGWITPELTGPFKGIPGSSDW